MQPIDKIEKHFTRLGNVASSVLLSDDFSTIKQKAERGDIDARALMVSANVVAINGISNTPILKTLTLSEQDKQRYVAEILALAEKGDIRALNIALIYYLQSPTHQGVSLLHDANLLFEQQRKGEMLVAKWGSAYPSLQMFYRVWLIDNKEFAECLEPPNEIVLKEAVDLAITWACELSFDNTYYQKINNLNQRQRLQAFSALIEEDSFYISSSSTSFRRHIAKFNDFSNKLAVFRMFDLPYASELSVYWLYRSSNAFNNFRRATYQAEKFRFEKQKTNQLISPLMRLVGSAYGRFFYNTELSKQEQVDPQLRGSLVVYNRMFFEDIKQYRSSFLTSLKSGNYMAFQELYWIATEYEQTKDDAVAWALLKASEQYSPAFTEGYQPLFKQKGLQIPNQKTLDIELEKLRPYLPSQESVFNTDLHLNWKDVIQPYVLQKLQEQINLLETE